MRIYFRRVESIGCNGFVCVRFSDVGQNFGGAFVLLDCTYVCMFAWSLGTIYLCY